MAEPPHKSPVQRPLSPHLQVYRIMLQMTSGMSIFHRFTGIGLAGGVVVLVAWLVCLAWLPSLYDPLMWLLTSIIGKICLFGWTWAFFFHMGCGIRHLLWDFGKCFSMDCIYSSGRIVLASSALLTIGLWIKILWHQGVLPWL